MGRAYAKERNKRYWLRDGLKIKVKRAIKAAKHKGCFIIRNVVSKEDSKAIILKRPADSSLVNIGTSYRRFDSIGHDSFTKKIRELTVNWPMKGPKSDKLTKFGDFYKLVAECLGFETAYVDQHDRIIIHSDKLQVS